MTKELKPKQIIKTEKFLYFHTLVTLKWPLINLLGFMCIGMAFDLNIEA